MSNLTTPSSDLFFLFHSPIFGPIPPPNSPGLPIPAQARVFDYHSEPAISLEDVAVYAQATDIGTPLAHKHEPEEALARREVIKILESIIETQIYRVIQTIVFFYIVKMFLRMRI
ncbi:hypothetical protein PM082_013471 [Marasmius tenuissimus]|nr:hypothetical protein PM082_013471 [Marasmius tenuissimus]